VATPTSEEIEEQLNLAYEQINEGQSKYPSMTFEEGVRDALSWMQGDAEVPPME